MRKFELWLDESGDFNNDSRKTESGAKSSLVGGLLIENNAFPDPYIDAIIPKSTTYHSVNQKDQLDRFKRIEEKLFQNKANRMVVFSNQECIMILDNNLTYLNIMTEGILQLVKQLKAQYGEIFLRVIIANRVDTTTGRDSGQSIVPVDEYVYRLNEKLLVSGLERSISDKEWELQTSSARKDRRLMLADIICNTFYTRGRKKKFNESERGYIENIYNDEKKTLVFSVFESVLERNFRNNLVDNRIGEAVAGICLSNNDESLSRCFSLLKAKFSACGVHDLTFQYKFIEAYIVYYINVVRDFELCLDFLRNLLDYYIPLLEEYCNGGVGLALKLTLDIKFYMMTVYTHLGDIEQADMLEKECEKQISKLPASLETVDYSIKFETRKIVNLINAFDFETALEHADAQVKRCREVKELLDLVASDDSIYYEELAKALGTRLQVRTFMYRKQGDYELCKQDSEDAIREFVNETDKRRQYLYRVQLETEHRDYDTALVFLKMAVGLSETASIKELWRFAQQDSPFAVNAYVRLMAEADGARFSDEMYGVLSKSDYFTKIDETARLFHPMEIILWKYAYYCARNGMQNAAVKYYEKAVNVCFDSSDITMNVIGMGADFELHAFMLDLQSKGSAAHNRNMQKRWSKIRQMDQKGILENVFGTVDFHSGESGYYKNLGRKITY